MVERVVRSRRVYDGRIVALRVDEVVLPSGRTTSREIVEHRGAVAIVPLTADGEVLLVRQHRGAAGATLVEIPAGTLEPGENVEAALTRELAEETGMQAARFTPLAAFYPSPGFLTEVVHLYLARGLTPHRLEAKEADLEEEDLAVVRVSLAEARALVDRGEIRDAKSMIGILLASAVIARPEGPKQSPP